LTQIRPEKYRNSWVAVWAVCIACIVFAIAIIAVAAVVVTGNSTVVMDWIDLFIEWDQFGPVTLLLLIGGMMAATWTWRRLTILDERDEQRKKECNCTLGFGRKAFSEMHTDGHPNRWPFSLLSLALRGAGDRTRTGDNLLGRCCPVLQPISTLNDLPTGTPSYLLRDQS